MLLLVFLMSGLDLKLATTLNQIYDEYTVHFQMNNYFYCIAKKRQKEKKNTYIVPLFIA